MKSIFREFILCCVLVWVVCGVSHARPSQEIEPLSPLAHAYFDIETKVIREYKVFVAKPKGKHTKPYPALVVLDGNAHFPIAINQYIMHQYTPSAAPLLIVGIGYDGELAYDTPRRTRDYTPMARDGRGGGAAQFYEVLRTDIMPWLKATYLTQTHTESDYISVVHTGNVGFFGHSFGGLFGLYVFLHHQEMFSHYMIASPSLWWGRLELPNSLECQSEIVFSHGMAEPNKGGMPLEGFIESLRARCANMCVRTFVLSGGHGDSIRPSIVRLLGMLLHQGEIDDCGQDI